jgi:ABC-type tungstate transport system permease subunit
MRGKSAKIFHPIALALGLLGASPYVDTAGASWEQGKSIVLASTTSPQNSGLFGHILPLFTAKTGMRSGWRARQPWFPINLAQ